MYKKLDIVFDSTVNATIDHGAYEITFTKGGTTCSVSLLGNILTTNASILHDVGIDAIEVERYIQQCMRQNRTSVITFDRPNNIVLISVSPGLLGGGICHVKATVKDRSYADPHSTRRVMKHDERRQSAYHEYSSPDKLGATIMTDSITIVFYSQDDSDAQHFIEFGDKYKGNNIHIHVVRTLQELHNMICEIDVNLVMIEEVLYESHCRDITTLLASNKSPICMLVEDAITVKTRAVNSMGIIYEKWEKGNYGKELLYYILNRIYTMVNVKEISNIIKNCPITITRLDPNHRIMYTNRCISGSSISKVIGQSIYNYIDDMYRRTVSSKITESFTSNITTEYETTLAVSGSLRYTMTIVTPLMINRGAVESVTLNSIDITKQKRNEFSALKEKKNAERSALAQETFLTTMSHEIRTPLNAILGVTSILEGKNIEGDDVSAMLDIQKSAGDQLLSIVNNILEYSKVKTEELTLVLHVFTLGQISRHLSSLFGVTPTGIIFNVNVDDDIKELNFKGDHVKLQQILTNIIGNAMKFTQSGSVKINIGTGAQSDTIIRLPDVLAIDDNIRDYDSDSSATRNVVNYISFEVRDTGPGIDPSFIPRIFDPFARASPFNQTRGSGLGLTISQTYVKAMGGVISVNSTLGEGSIFKFTVPLRQKNNIPKPVGAPVSYISIHDSVMKILLVEDNYMNRFIQVQMLNGFGYTDIDVADDGMDAISKWKNKTYDIILMDVQLPLKDGIEATREIRQLEGETSRPHTVICGMSANVFDKKQRDAISAGMDKYMTKPVDSDRLRRYLKSIDVISQLQKSGGY